MIVSVVIPVSNPCVKIQQLLLVLGRQDPPIEQVVIANSGCADIHVPLVKGLEITVIKVACGEFDHAGTRTLLAQRASGDILVFLTQDVVIESSDAITRLVACFSDKTVAGVYGRQIPHENAHVFARFLRAFNYPAEGFSNNDAKNFRFSQFSHSFGAWRKSAIASVGYFEEPAICSEEILMCMKLRAAGWKIVYESRAVVRHSHNYSVVQEFRRYFDVGVFQSKNKPLLRRYERTEKEGLRFVIAEQRFLMREKKYHLMPVAFMRNMFKYTGYLLGRVHYLFPLWLCAYLSGNKVYWRRIIMGRVSSPL